VRVDSNDCWEVGTSVPLTGIRLIGEIHDRRLYLAHLARLEDWPTRVEEPARPFVVFTAFDATRLTDDELLNFARLLLEQGCVYACSWGPEALRFHNAFDEAAITAELAGKPYVDEGDVVMTTSHNDESLDDALWFAVFSAYPAYGEITGVLAISEQTWAGEIESRFSDAEQWNERLLEAEDGGA
jgi:hypothetical protein